MIWHVWWLAIAGLLATVAWAIRNSFDLDRDYHIPADVVDATERARTAQLEAVRV
jgi:cytochrome o ubiquinol oxidase subunit 1